MICRCPWCGSKLKSHSAFTLMGKKCPICKNKYKAGNNNRYYFICALITMLLCWYFVDMKLGVILIIVIHNILLTFVPYERDTNKFIALKGIKADLHLNGNKAKRLIYRLMLSPNSIVTICFVDKNNKPISQLLCMTTEFLNWKNSLESCNMYFLPQGQIDVSQEKESIFNIFYNNKFIGQGNLLEYIDNF